MQEDIERFRYARCRHSVALDNSLVRTASSRHIVRLDSKNLLKYMACAECLKSPDLHLSETLSAELCLTAEWLLRDERVRADRACVHLVLDHVTEFQEVCDADSSRLVEHLARLSVIEMCRAIAR